MNTWNKGKRWSAPKQQHPKFDETVVATGLHIFCDGACEPNPGAGGWGFVFYRNGDEKHVEHGGCVQTTNNAMELTGMLKAIDYGVRLWAQPVTIWCDSIYVVNGCNDWRHGWKAKGLKRKGDKADPKNTAIANLDLWKAIDQLLSGSRAAQIAIKWVKGHNGAIGNERADELSLIGRQQAIDAVVEPADSPTAEYRQIMGVI